MDSSIGWAAGPSVPFQIAPNETITAPALRLGPTRPPGQW